MAASAPKPGSGGRIFYLDAVRAFAMFFGIMAHGLTIASPYINDMPLFLAIKTYNDLFRAATFFLVSGFFTALVFRKNDFPTYVRTRSEVILIPLIASMIFIVPFTNWMIHSWHNGYMSLWAYFSGGYRNPTVGNDTWALHIWFLYSLAIYATLAPLLAKIIDSNWFSKALNYYLDRTAGWTHWANVILFAIAIMAGRAAYDQGFRYLVDDTMWHWIVRASLNHLPMFFMGMVTFTNRRFLDSISVLSIPGIIVFGVAYWAIREYGAEMPRDIERVIYWTVRGGLSVFLISSIIWFFKTYANKPGKWLTFAVDSAYSFYLFHFTFIYAAAWFSRLFTHNLYINYLFVLLLATPATLLWHAYVIDRVPFLRYIFTGKKTRRTATDASRPKPA